MIISIMNKQISWGMFKMPQERSHCMRYRKLGGTGLEVSEIGLGAECWNAMIQKR